MTVHGFVRDHRAMIAAAVQGDVDRISKGAHEHDRREYFGLIEAARNLDRAESRSACMLGGLRPPRKVIGLGAALLGACSTFQSASAPSDTDAGIEGAGEGGADVSNDRRIDDPDADAGALVASPCADGGVHLLCEDFDRDGTVVQAPTWTSGPLSLGSSRLVSTDRWRSPPQSLQMFTTNANANAYLTAERAIFTKGVRCAFDFAIAKSGSGSGKVRLFNLIVKSGTSLFGRRGQGHGVATTDRVFLVCERRRRRGQLTVDPLGSLDDDQWHTVVLTATQKDYVVAVDGKPTTVTLPSMIGAFDQETASPGIVAEGATAPWVVFMDNIVCDSL